MSEKQITVIKPKTGWLEINFREVKQYRDLIFLFVKRNFVVQYKQTILGPLWFIINPLLTTVMFTFVFGTIAGLSTDEVPQFAFYLSGTALWQYFATCLNQTSTTFTGNAHIFGKVYFPRITMPIATVIFSLISFGVVFIMSIITNCIYMLQGANITPNWSVILIPILVIQVAVLGLGFGIIISSLTTKYRDLAVLVSFGVQLWMYATPVAYSKSQLSPMLCKIVMLNPVSPIICNFRYALLGCGEFEVGYWLISMVVTVVVLAIGIIMFNRVEKTFMDTV